MNFMSRQRTLPSLVAHPIVPPPPSCLTHSMNFHRLLPIPAPRSTSQSPDPQVTTGKPGNSLHVYCICVQFAGCGAVGCGEVRCIDITSRQLLTTRNRMESENEKWTWNKHRIGNILGLNRREDTEKEE